MNQKKHFKYLLFVFTTLIITFGLLLIASALKVSAVTIPDIGKGIPLPPNFVIYYPFDEATKVDYFYYYNYGASTHRSSTNYLFYSIDFHLVPDGGGTAAQIYPIAKGKIVSIDEHKPRNGTDINYGWTVLMEHSDAGYPGYVSLYAHLKEDPRITNPKLLVGSPVNSNTLIGLQGNSGGGADRESPNPIHLHFSILYCDYQDYDPTNSVATYANLPQCKSVVPEPFVGNHIDEGFNWWHINKSKVTSTGIGQITIRGDRLIPYDILNDRIPPAHGWWGENTTKSNTINEALKVGAPIKFDVYFGDDETGIGEVRLTATYDNWHIKDSTYIGFDPTAVWRIIARCKPVESNDCRDGHWYYEWNWSNEDKLNLAPSPLPIPWNPPLSRTLRDGTTSKVCISFDVFDKAGNKRYAPQGTLCSSNAVSSGLSPQIESESRLIYVNGKAEYKINDNASFKADLTLPDGIFVSPGQSLTKTWRLQNTGTTTWGAGYKLVFVDGEQMSAPPTSDIPSTSPNSTVDLSISLTAPTASGEHTGYFQLRNPQGTYFGPKIWVKINVRTTSSKITTLTADPTSPANAKTVRVYAKVVGVSNLRAIRLKVDGQLIGEYGGPEHTFDWNTSGFAAGAHNIVLEAADQTDTSWSRPEVRSISYTLLGTTSSPNLKPNQPSLISPYNWYVYYSGSTANLCTQAQGDPDGDAITGYYFDIYDSAQGWNSGWTGSNCVTTGSLGPYNYKWHVKVRDSRGAESDWSTDRNFTLLNPNLSITDLSFQPQDGNSEIVKIRACTTGGSTIRVDVNDANDGSANGQWHRINELGAPCYNDVDAPLWHTLEAGGNYSDGPHLVRVEAHGANAGWDGAAAREAVYTLPHRRPSGFNLVSPLSATGNTHDPVFLKSRTVTFKWDSALRANGYILSVGTSTNPLGGVGNVYTQNLNSSTTQQTVSFNQDYPVLYWQVRATNDMGSTDTGDQLIGIDQTTPTCMIQSLSPVSYENNFQVNWSGTDTPAGIRAYDIQYLDSSRGSWSDWLTAVPSSKTYELFVGQTGHNYGFRCRATDNAENLGVYPNTADQTVKIDPAARPPEPWWGTGYSSKRNITIQNNMPSVGLPSEYPVRVVFNSGTTPSAAEIYSASLSPNKCDDLRIVYNNTSELNRVVKKCSAAEIEIWFRSKAGIGGGGTSIAHQLYYGNPSPGAVLADPNQVWYPMLESGTTNLYFFQEGPGYSTSADASGNGRNCTLGPGVQWGSGKFGSGIQVYQQSSGGIRSLLCGTAPILNAFTVEFWINTSSTTDGRLMGALGGGGNGGSGNNWQIEYRNRIHLEVWPCTTCGSHGVESNFDLTNTQYKGKWNHIAVTFDGGNQVKFYINGNYDSTKTIPDQSGINTYNLPLEIGATESSGQINASLGTVRISNYVRNSFPYGSFSQITSEPSVQVGSLIAPSVVGTVDLEVQSFNVYPNPGGGVLVEVVVQNLGTLSTTNGFFTDLYVNHLPNGTGDLSSYKFWVNEPIPAGGSATLTTVLPSMPGTMDVKASGISETTGTLYTQVDSTGALSESTKSNNISAPVTACVATPDLFEVDDTSGQASTLVLRQAQAHNFDKPGDADWAKFSAVQGKNYSISTSALGPAADTYLYLYDTDGVTLLASNDDFGDTLASKIQWVAPTTGTYYALVKHWNPNVAGCGTTYTLNLAENYFFKIPIFSKGSTTVTYKIAGQVLDSQQNALAGVTVSLGGTSSVTNSSGFYTMTGLQANTYTVIPSKTGYTFTPPSRSVTVGPDAASQDFVASPDIVNTWITKTSMPTARERLGAAAASNGKIYAIGGWVGTEVPLSIVEEYNLLTDSWAVKTNMPTARWGAGVVTASNGKIYVIGGGILGQGRLSTVEEYNPLTDTWTTKSSMPTARWGVGVAAANNGKIYVVGGNGGSTKVEEYDPLTDIWATKANMPTARESLAVAAASNGKIYAIGGYNGGNLSTVEEFDPLTNTWVTKSSMPTARCLNVAAAINGKIYVLDGYGNGGPILTTVEEYNPLTDTWASKSSMHTARYAVGVVTASNGKIYAIGGFNGSIQLSVVEEYTP